MPLPVLLGIPWLGSNIAAIFSLIMGFFGTFLGRRLALVATFVVVVLSLTTALLTSLQLLVVGVQFATPVELDMAVALFLPSNFKPCVTVCITARVLQWVYDWNVRIAKYKLL